MPPTDRRRPFDRRFIAVLGAVIDAGRIALRELGADEIPAKLQRVARSTGKGLPSPLASSLLAEVDGSDWFREKVLAAFEGMDRGDTVAEAFLRREEGWWVTVAGALAGVADSERDIELKKAKDELAAVRGLLDESRRREREQAGRISELETDRSEVAEERMAPLRAAADRERRRAGEAEKRLSAATNRGDELAASVADAEERLRLLYERLMRTRAERAELDRRLTAGERATIPADPIGIARWLDDAARVLAPFLEGEAGVPPVAPMGVPTPLRLPPGVRPDEREGIEALRELQPRWVLVDGHNVLGATDHRSIGDPKARRDLVTGLGLLGRALPKASIVVVFDSALVGGRESVDVAPGVTVRFSPAATAADDVLAEEAGELGPGTVVISNDREVQERTAMAGALVLWSDALVAWLSEARREGVTTV